MAETVFEKWDKRGCWREVKDGGVWVVPPFGVDLRSGRFTDLRLIRNSGPIKKPDVVELGISLGLLEHCQRTCLPDTPSEKMSARLRARCRR